MKVWSTYQSQCILSSVDEKLPPPIINNHKRIDIVVIKLRRSFDRKQYVRPVWLPSKNLEPGSVCYTAGWGQTTTMTPIDHQNG